VAGTHLCVNDMEHIWSVPSQAVGYPDVHRGAWKSAGPIVYHLHKQHMGNRFKLGSMLSTTTNC